MIRITKSLTKTNSILLTKTSKIEFLLSRREATGEINEQRKSWSR